MSTFTPAMKTFIAADRFAVIGRVLSDRTRFDNKVLRWYQNHELPVTPVRPDKENSEAIESLSVLSSPLDLPSLPTTAVSIIINPAIGLPLLKSLFPTPPNPATEPKALWFQPGADSSEIHQYIKQRGLEDRVVFGGPCILVLGESLLKEKAGGSHL
ncbi:hypothetical protein P7C73_g4757, partial [Tremellales sp. Uapishka_1]